MAGSFERCGKPSRYIIPRESCSLVNAGLQKPVQVLLAMKPPVTSACAATNMCKLSSSSANDFCKMSVYTFPSGHVVPSGTVKLSMTVRNREVVVQMYKQSSSLYTSRFLLRVLWTQLLML
jgi:hypothetical protein